MPSATSIASVVAGLSALRGVLAGFDNTSDSNVAVYWGQNSYGQGTGDLAQQRLSYYCENDDIDIIPMAFMTVITDSTGNPQLNFANQGDKCTLFNNTSLFSCPELAEDIPLCQQQYNKTILLSIGGATYTEGGFANASEAQTAADLIWATFGPLQPNTTSTALRPFGNASLDGFDFDFESTTTNIAPFAQRLRALMDAAPDGKQRFLTAAPQCPYPDAADDAFLSGEDAVAMDALFVQFYNNYCGVQAFVPNSTTDQWNFNFATWHAWAANTSVNAGVKVLLGVPASASAAGSGYLGAGELQPVLEYVRNYSSFGGVMMWDVSQAYGNAGFLEEVKKELVGGTNGTDVETEVYENCEGPEARRRRGGRFARRGVVV